VVRVNGEELIRTFIARDDLRDFEEVAGKLNLPYGQSLFIEVVVLVVLRALKSEL
jgi:hypothetical protein